MEFTLGINLRNKISKKYKKVLDIGKWVWYYKRADPLGSRKHLENYIVQERIESAGNAEESAKLWEQARKKQTSQVKSETVLKETQWIWRPSEVSELQCWETLKRLNSRVWSWLRTNAGGVPNTCKSNGALRCLVANGWVTREQPDLQRGITLGNEC